jgi:hypothetical protein
MAPTAMACPFRRQTRSKIWQTHLVFRAGWCRWWTVTLAGSMTHHFALGCFSNGLLQVLVGGLVDVSEAPFPVGVDGASEAINPGRLI